MKNFMMGNNRARARAILRQRQIEALRLKEVQRVASENKVVEEVVVQEQEPVVEPVAEEPVPEPVVEEPIVEPVAEEPVPEPVAEETVVEPTTEKKKKRKKKKTSETTTETST
jgi:hypothetical protein